jgi:hypothetical protein
MKGTTIRNYKSYHPQCRPAGKAGEVEIFIFRTPIKTHNPALE